MPKMKYHLLLLMFVLFTSCREQKKTVSHDHITAEPKDTITSLVPNSMVRSIGQDKNGNILIASFNGVMRYNGKSFTYISPEIPSPSFWDVLEDRKGNLWFGTRDSGVYYKHRSRPDFQHFTTEDGLASNMALHLYEDKAGNIWFGTGSGASRYDGKSFRNFTTKDGLPSNDINTIMEDSTGKLWFGTRGAACFYDGKTFTVLRNQDGKTFNNVWSIIEDSKGYIWFGATTIKDKKGDTLVVTTGLWRYDGSSFTKVSKKGAGAIIQDKKGNIWTTGAVNPNGAGAWKLYRYDQNSLYTKEPTATEIMSIEKMLCGILEANEGSIWFGSLNGVYRYDGNTITDFKRKDDQE